MQLAWNLSNATIPSRLSYLYYKCHFLGATVNGENRKWKWKVESGNGMWK